MFRILLAEDDQVMRAYLARALERSGYEVVAVDRGTAAAPLLEAERFGLLLTDIIIPEMHRIQLARHCDTVSPSTEVIFITGFSGVALRRRVNTKCLNSGQTPPSQGSGSGGQAALCQGKLRRIEIGLNDTPSPARGWRSVGV